MLSVLFARLVSYNLCLSLFILLIASNSIFVENVNTKFKLLIVK